MIRPGIRRLFRLPARGAEQADQDLEEEIQLHLELRAERLQREGMSAEAALAEALRRLMAAEIRLTGASDHGVSEALYLDDPDGNGVELYWDRVATAWRDKPILSAEQIEDIVAYLATLRD